MRTSIQPSSIGFSEGASAEVSVHKKRFSQDISDQKDTIALVVPTLNAGENFVRWLQALQSQSVSPGRPIIIDSSSTDRTADIASEAGFEVHIIPRDEFSHGGVRQMSVAMLHDRDVIVFMTQDALLADPNALANLIRPFKDLTVGAAYGRQLPRIGAGPIEAHARLFNYPSESHVWGLSDVPTHGIKTSFISNSFAAWRRVALMEVGGFPSHTIQNEDAYVASKLIQAGWRIAYCADATVYHSHDYGCAQEFRRYFDIGVFHARDPWIRQSFGQAEGEGMRYVKSELRYLRKTKPSMIPSALLRTSLKLVGYKLGNMESRLPCGIKTRLSTNKRYWLQGG